VTTKTTTFCDVTPCSLVFISQRPSNFRVPWTYGAAAEGIPSLQEPTSFTVASTRTECELLTRLGWVIASKNEYVPLGQGLETLWLVDINRLPGQPEVTVPPTLPWQRGMREEWWHGFGGSKWCHESSHATCLRVRQEYKGTGVWVLFWHETLFRSVWHFVYSAFSSAK